MSNYLSNEGVLLLGAGPMAVEYAKVLKALGLKFHVIGRGLQSAATFTEQTDHPVFLEGLEHWVENQKFLPKVAIVAVSMEQLAPVTISLLKIGIRKILVEKPAGLNSLEIRNVAICAQQNEAHVYVAYNRRFYSSTLQALEIIKADGGLTSFNFEFTEWIHAIAELDKPIEVKKALLLGNSSHVIDLAFFLGGEPIEISCYTTGGLDWHPNATIYAGAGRVQNGALFSYQANWEAPGRWGVEILTRKHRLIFRPLEELHCQDMRSIIIRKIDLEDELDHKFKPGLYRQLEAFLLGKNDENLLDIQNHVSFVKFYDLIDK
ncbi:MAG: myo-inositol 2-dehydrogenase [Desulfosporosinus sp. BRH_c37]|nr:MAG: myo-inositol 2-dehydrogenase [Desulfosporosinus sp. BRH_c37]